MWNVDICFCALAGSFTTDIVRNGNALNEGDNHGAFELNEKNMHPFNDDRTRMCKEFRRRVISYSLSHAIGNRAMGFACPSLEWCITVFYRVSVLVLYNSHNTRQGVSDYTKEFVTTIVARETKTLGLHHASMRAPLFARRVYECQV